MSVSLESLKSELRDNYLCLEEVLSGMDNYITQLEQRVLEQEQRISKLEGQLAALTNALFNQYTPS